MDSHDLSAALVHRDLCTPGDPGDLRLGQGSVELLGSRPEHMGDALPAVDLNNLGVREVHACACDV